jgi:hypothetical protein
VLADDAPFEDPHEVTDAMIDAFNQIRIAAELSTEVASRPSE